MINQVKTVILLGLLTALVLWVGQLIGGVFGLTFAFFIVMIMNIGMYWFSDKVILWMYKAQEVEKTSEIYQLVSKVAQSARIPPPKVYLLPMQNPNAFATGRDPKHAAVALSEGIIALLSKEELKGVVAHELAHIKNRDTLIATIAATLAGVIAYVASMARWTTMFGGFSSRDEREGTGLLELLVLAIITPLVATIIQLAISRQREYLADSTGSSFTGKPHALADALLKIDAGIKQHPLHGNHATASLFIANPFRGSALLELFSTHPPIQKRVEKLRER